MPRVSFTRTVPNVVIYAYTRRLTRRHRSIINTIDGLGPWHDRRKIETFSRDERTPRYIYICVCMFSPPVRESSSASPGAYSRTDSDPTFAITLPVKRIPYIIQRERIGGGERPFLCKNEIFELRAPANVSPKVSPPIKAEKYDWKNFTVR